MSQSFVTVNDSSTGYDDYRRHALDVANYFVEHSHYTKTPLQIQKLTYIAHGYMLGIHGKSLVFDQAEAWEHGPVFPKVYHEFKKWKFTPIGKVRYTPDPFTSDQQNVLDNVLAFYGRFCGYYLSQITHDNSDTETPWKKCYVYGASHTPIPDTVTQSYYKQLYNEHGYDY